MLINKAFSFRRQERHKRGNVEGRHVVFRQQSSFIYGMRIAFLTHLFQFIYKSRRGEGVGEVKCSERKNKSKRNVTQIIMISVSCDLFVECVFDKCARARAEQAEANCLNAIVNC